MTELGQTTEVVPVEELPFFGDGSLDNEQVFNS